jgi:hypothetical protein
MDVKYKEDNTILTWALRWLDNDSLIRLWLVVCINMRSEYSLYQYKQMIEKLFAVAIQASRELVRMLYQWATKVAPVAAVGGRSREDSHVKYQCFDRVGVDGEEEEELAVAGAKIQETLMRRDLWYGHLRTGVPLDSDHLTAIQQLI